MAYLLYPDTPEDAWQLTRQCVTGDDILAIAGLSADDSAYSLYWKKLGTLPAQDCGPRGQLARHLARYISDCWEEQHDGTHLTVPGNLTRSAARPWQLAEPDRVILELKEKQQMPEIAGVLQAAVWADDDRRAWDSGIPAPVRARLLWHMDVLEVPAGHAAVLFVPSGEFRSFEIRNGCELNGLELAGQACNWCADLKEMRAAGEEFAGRLRDLRWPDPDGSKATLAALRARFTPAGTGKSAAIEPALWDTWLAARSQAEEADSDRRACEAKIRARLEDADEITVNGRLVARRTVTAAHVKAHTRHQDAIRLIGRNGG
jgi:hypothetical protein